MNALETASTDELIEELEKRAASSVIVLHDLKGADHGKQHSSISGDYMAAMGMLLHELEYVKLQIMAQRMGSVSEEG